MICGLDFKAVLVMLTREAMFVVLCIVCVLFSPGNAGKLPRRDGAQSHPFYNENRNNGCILQVIAGVRAFTKEEGAVPRIVGGKEAWPHSWPWQVELRYSGMTACGGAILNPLWIITARHCFKRYAKELFWTVWAGKHDLEDEHETCQQSAKVAKILLHEDYNSISKQHDVALVKLLSPLAFDDCVRPISLWGRELPFLKRCTITGWGSTTESGPHTNKLQEANVTLLENETCVRFYGGLIRSTMLCAGEEKGGVDTCQGDSGGPLVCYTGSQYELVGVVSWGVGCGRAQKPGIYTRVPSYIEWISSNIDGELGVNSTWTELAGGRIAASRKLPPPTGAVNACSQASVKPCQLNRGYIGFDSSDPGGELRVVNVTEACPNSWPWQVSLQSEENHYCSGTLVDERWVLTARHCRAEAGDMVVLGTHDLNAATSQQVTVKAVYSQPYDGSFPPMHDLALLYLSVPARLGSSVFPACLTSEDWTFDPAMSCVTTGWGYRRSTPQLSPDVLYQAEVSPLPELACWSGWGQVFSSAALLCTQPAASSPCLGDAGAPFLCEKNGQYYLAGVMALGLKRCDQQKPAIFTNLSGFQDWIKKTMAEGF